MKGMVAHCQEESINREDRSSDGVYCSYKVLYRATEPQEQSNRDVEELSTGIWWRTQSRNKWKKRKDTLCWWKSRKSKSKMILLMFLFIFPTNIQFKLPLPVRHKTLSKQLLGLLSARYYPNQFTWISSHYCQKILWDGYIITKLDMKKLGSCEMRWDTLLKVVLRSK